MGSRSKGNYTNPCLTLHQPWASLLVYGIKRVEGRSWPAPLRASKPKPLNHPVFLMTGEGKSITNVHQAHLGFPSTTLDLGWHDASGWHASENSVKVEKLS
uniref:ASCH domain-containing protein n=1 Tax=Vitis vinifera TaxID=29760 RepID=F6H8P5_VITVI